MHPEPNRISRNVRILSLVSLFTDMASEMLYPVMPIYLRSIGFSIVFIGVLEGLAEAVAGLSKGFFGHWSDVSNRRLPFVRIGYGLSALSKPLPALLIHPGWVFLARTVDRLGKGIRTGARDALLSDEATPATKGRVFGFHRSMDTIGAVAGPLLALLFLQTSPGAYRDLFLLAFLPGLLAIACTFWIREKARAPVSVAGKPGFTDFLRYWKRSPSAYRRLAAALLVFALFNSSDVFLLLKMKDSGFGDQWVIGIYIFYNVVYAVFAYPLGIAADRIGMKKVFTGGLCLFACVYAGMAFAQTQTAFLFLFFLYGLYAAATEGIAKAWITNISEKKDAATAIGTYTAFQSICALGASVLAGVLWQWKGAGAVFLLSAGVTAVVAMYTARLR